MSREVLAGAILAGGRARRFGNVPKGLIEIQPGLSIIAHEIEVMKAAGLQDLIIVSNDQKPYQGFGVAVVPDSKPGNGPLGGIETALGYFAPRYSGVLMLPCDLPAITAREITSLKTDFFETKARVVFASVGSDWHPLCSVFHTGALADIRRAIDFGDLKIRHLWDRLGARNVEFDSPDAFYNINAPQDWKAWREKRMGLAKAAPQMTQDHVYV